MTQWLTNKKIPSMVLVPNNGDDKGYKTKVSGVGTVKECPSCKRTGPIDALWLGDGNKWPNIAVICGKPCGIFWGLASLPPDNLVEIVEE